MKNILLPRDSAIARGRLCWCPDLDLKNGVGDSSMCKTCGKLVAIIQLEQFKPRRCICIRPPRINVFYFCERCRGSVRGADGNIHPEAYISVKRAIYMAENVTPRS
jgi:hypothetical protein